jgi:Ca-activated chloride channel family protein
MNTRIPLIVPIFLAGSIALSACGAAAPYAPTPIAIAPLPKPADTNRVLPAATAAPARPTDAPRPAATMAPASGAAINPPVYAPPQSETAGRAPIPPTSVLPVRPAPTATPGLPIDNRFRDAGVNPWTDAARDHLSTFAVDVDTASYDIARRYLKDGQLPPYDAVRVEEFVNAFKPGYGLPRDVAFALYADGAPSPFHGQGTVLLRFGVQGGQPELRLRKSASYVFVVDVSGSMATDNRMGLAKDALKMLVSRLGPNDTVGIVAFTNTARDVLYPTAANNQYAINSALDSLRPENATNVQKGLELGYQMAYKSFRADSNNRMFLLSDGVANEGGLTPEAILQSVGEYASKGIQLHSIGVGFGNYNDTLMEKLADKGNGQYVYINNAGDAEKLVAEKFASFQTIALDAKTQVEFNPDTVISYRQIGYENRAVADSDFRNNNAGGGGIGAGRSAVALYAVQLRPGAQGRIATLQLRWQDPANRDWKELNGNVNTWDIKKSYEEAPAQFRLAATVAQFAEILRQSPYAREWPLWDIATRADGLRGELREDSDVAVFADLTRKAATIR